MNDIFISYSRGDSQFVDRLIRDLEQKGVPAWVDREDIEAGDSWRGQITEGIKNCKAFVIVLSPNSVGSKNVSRELSLAESNDRMIIPIVYQACNIPSGMEYQLAELQWINLTAMTYEEGLQRLVRVLDRPMASADGHSEQRRSDTARLRQVLESSAAPEKQASSFQETFAQPASDSLIGRLTKSKLALAVVALVVLAGIGLYSFSGGSSSEPSTSEPSAEPSPAPSEKLDSTPSGASATVIIGNSKTHFYFWPDCPGYDRVPENFRVEFAGEKEATDAGYTEAENCPVPIYGDSNTLLYHRNECPGHDSVPEQRIVEFRNETEAEKAGYKRAADCP